MFKGHEGFLAILVFIIKRENTTFKTQRWLERITYKEYLHFVINTLYLFIWYNFVFLQLLQLLQLLLLSILLQLKMINDYIMIQSNLLKRSLLNPDETD